MIVIGLVMAGGRGSRMAGSGGPAEKLLIEHRGRPVVLGVVDALRGSGVVSEVHAATSPHAPAAADALGRAGVGIIPTRGAGYSLDLGEAVSALAGRGRAGPVLVVPGDMPFLRAGDLRCAARAYAEWAAAAGRGPGRGRQPPAWACIVAPAAKCIGRGAEHRTPEGDTAYTGVSVASLPGAARTAATAAGECEARIALDSPGLLISYNDARDVALAARLGRSQGGRPPP